MPARYRYDIVDGFADVTQPSGRRQMTRAILSATRQLEHGAAAQGVSPSYLDCKTALSAIWAVVGPHGHPHEQHYRVSADQMMSRLTELVATEVGATHHRAEWRIDVGAGVVVVRPHRVVEHSWGAVTVQTVGTRHRDQARIAGLIAALSIGARAAFPDARVTIELVDPCGEIIEAAVVDDEALIERYRDAIIHIERGNFAPRPDPRACPACPFFLVCGA